jgi:hypothetical protein
MTTRTTFIALAILALAGVLFSCTPNGGSIYFAIEGEKKTPTSTLTLTLTIADIVNIPAAATLPYFVAAGAIFNGSLPDPTNTISWPTPGQSPVAIAPPQSGAICQSLASSPNPVDGSLYGGFFSSNVSTMGLYHSTVPPTAYTFDLTAGGTQITGNGGSVSLAQKQITLLQVAGPVGAQNLFVVAASIPLGGSNYTYELDYSPNPTVPGSWAQVAGISSTAAITGVGYASTTNTYFVTADSTSAGQTSVLYRSVGGAFPTFTDVTAGVTMQAGDELKGVTVDNATAPSTVLIPARQGNVYYSLDGGNNWLKVTSGDNVNNSVVGFLTVSQNVASASPLAPVYLVGSDGNGFYYMSLTPTATLTRFSDLTVTGLYAGSVAHILVDTDAGRYPSGNMVLFGTKGAGLWRNSFDRGTGQLNSTWVNE